MAAPIQSPAKCEVRSVIRFLNAKVNIQRKFTQKKVAFYGNDMNRQNVANKETARWEKFNEEDEVQEQVMT